MGGQMNSINKGKALVAVVSSIISIGILFLIFENPNQESHLFIGRIIALGYSLTSLTFGMYAFYLLHSQGAVSKRYFNLLGALSLVTGLALSGLGSVHIYVSLAYLAAYVFYTMLYYSTKESRFRYMVVLNAAVVVVLWFDQNLFDQEHWESRRWHNKVEFVAGSITSFLLVAAFQVMRVVTEMQFNLKMTTTQEREVMTKLNKILAHNIRGPVAEISMRSEIAKLKGDHSLDGIQPALEKLLTITDELFKYNTDGVEQRLTINDLCKSLKAVYGSDVVLEIQLHENYRLDEGRVLMYALQNFISNANKFSDEPPVLKIQKFQGELVFTIVDTGIGMSPSQLERLGRPIASQTGGMGIGLMLSIGLLNANGYHLQVASKSGEGTVFTLSKEIFTLKSQLPGNWTQIFFKAQELDLETTLL